MRVNVFDFRDFEGKAEHRVYCTIAVRLRGDTRLARRASRESDGLIDLIPGVALSESGNPGLIDATLLVSSGCNSIGLASFKRVAKDSALPSTTRRYSRVQLCATKTRPAWLAMPCICTNSI